MLLREQDVARSRLYRHRLRQSIPASILLVPHFYALTRLHKIKINLLFENSFGAASRIRNEDSRLLTNRNLKSCCTHLRIYPCLGFPAYCFARIYGDPKCGRWPRVADFLSATNPVRQARDAFPGRICASFLGTEPPGEFGTLESSSFQVQAHSPIVDHGRMTSWHECGLEKI